MADPKPPGRDLDPVAREILALKGRTRDLESPSGTQRGQVMKDLLGRVSYFSTGDDFYVHEKTPAGAAPEPVWSELFGQPVSFTLGSRRLVRLAVTASLNASFQSQSVDLSGTAQITLRTVIDGEPGYAAFETERLGVSVPLGEPISRNAEASTRARVERYIVMEPGVHTFQAGLKDVDVYATGTGPWSARVSADAPALSVDVLQIIHE